MASTVYDKNFYEDQQDGSVIAAREVWPVLFQYFRPNSVIDIGCGVGTWLSALDSFGISDYIGVDGSYVQPEHLFISKDKFVAHDLTKPFSAPKKFDLAISLEVGEHLPDQSASTLIETLTAAADVVLFSAAIPGQKGTFHINEQWPEYWAVKFAEKDYVPVDCMRKPLWNNNRIPVWYRQNMLLFVERTRLSGGDFQHLRHFADQTDPHFLTRIHPELFHYYQSKVDSLSTFEGFARYKLSPLKGK